MGKTIAGFGEVMLRLCPEGKHRFGQAMPGRLEASFGGGEANVCVSLAMFGADSRYLTALPDNPVAHAFANQIRGIGCDAAHICYRKGGRMGIYYAEHGAALRGSNVVYDRDGSVISLLGPDDYDFESMLSGCGHLHLSGITPALSRNAYLATLKIAQTAVKMGIAVSCDLNFRKKLWNWEAGTDKRALAGRCMSEIVACADIIIGNEEDASDVFGIQSEGSAVESGRINIGGYSEVASKLSKRFPKAKFVAITLRESISADHNNWGGMLFDCGTGKSFFAPLGEDGVYAPYEIRDIVDRFGGGDSFCAGLIYALNDDEICAPETAIRYAVAASALKHTIPGDYNYASKSDVLNLMGGNTSGRVKR
ncbi:MAG: sugar kinase [Victivallaceae bacterium]|nr:sugar kinase [Victivallaceae bacterium]